MNPILTVGYEGCSREALLNKITSAGVQLLLDIRIRAQSRKAGFSKSGLQALCQSADIEYIHDRRLGTPESIMRKLRETGVYDWNAYAAHLNGEGEALETAVGLVHKVKVCLLCYEACAEECHRRIVAEELARRSGAPVLHI